MTNSHSVQSPSLISSLPCPSSPSRCCQICDRVFKLRKLFKYMKNVHNLLMYQPGSEPCQTPLLPDSENKVPILLYTADETRGPLYYLKEQFDGILVQHPTNENFELLHIYRTF
ncbi:hypothetical protein CEXT_226491 [Caerostris extrusa]|uniref:C2H2-type domain-containing protein n=1 Tax=Caerostris extrusa TaxID=172846 RepID=A0AAV4N439_CAEEX|nr:hypothetical protein CEXT_226491 [Caerostris extrusa]